MSTLAFYLKYRSWSIILSRFITIVQRYGFRGRKIIRVIAEYIDLLKKYNIAGTFPITANIIQRNPEIIKKIRDSGVELAIHGYNHVDYSQYSYNIQSDHLNKAVRIFENHNLGSWGFRCPYLRYNDATFRLLSEKNFLWDSSTVIYWDVLNNFAAGEKSRYAFEKVLNQYMYKPADSCLSLPHDIDGFIEIPVSLPDDDLLIDRIGIRDHARLGKIWDSILQLTYQRGELFTLQLHPERFLYCRETLDQLITSAKNKNPKIWISSLSGIARWWHEKKAFTLAVDKRGEDIHRIQMDCSDHATVMVKNSRKNKSGFFDDYIITNEREFILRCPTRPIIGVSASCSVRLLDFLKNEGFPFEISSQASEYSVYLKDYPEFDEGDELSVLGEIHGAARPFVRFWRWPYGCRSAFSITGDIDALSASDFFLRLTGRREN